MVILTAIQPRIHFEPVPNYDQYSWVLSVFGAQTADIESLSFVCGGVGQDPSAQGQSMACLAMKDKALEASIVDLEESAGQLPFMIGSATVSFGSQLIVVGGGATCFSMGTFWDNGVYKIDLANAASRIIPNLLRHDGSVTIKYQDSPKLTQPTAGGDQPGPQSNVSITEIPRVKLQSKSDFEKLVQNRKPVIIEGLNLGSCVGKWNTEYMVQSVGKAKEVGQVGLLEPRRIR